LGPHGSHPISGRATQTDAPSFRHAVKLAGEMRGHTPNTAHATHIMVGATIENGAALALRGWGPSCLGATCATHVSLSIFECPIMSSSTMAKPTPSVWLEDYRLMCRAGGVEDDLFIIQFLLIYLLTRLGLGSITCPKTRSIVWRISRRSTLESSTAPTYSQATLGI
jgi:hypothetical protein